VDKAAAVPTTVSLADLDHSSQRLVRVKADPSNRAKAAVVPTTVSLADPDLSSQ